MLSVFKFKSIWSKRIIIWIYFFIFLSQKICDFCFNVILYLRILYTLQRTFVALSLINLKKILVFFEDTYLKMKYTRYINRQIACCYLHYECTFEINALVIIEDFMQHLKENSIASFPFVSWCKIVFDATSWLWIISSAWIFLPHNRVMMPY